MYHNECITMEEICEHNPWANTSSIEYYAISSESVHSSPIATDLPRSAMVGSTVANVTVHTAVRPRQTALLHSLIIPLYLIIFLLSVAGNCLVLITLARNKRMRTVTNVYLLNLALSDLLLGVFCMPFTLIGQILKNFIFGGTMCKLIPYFQAVSVAVSVWTLVAISLERYFAICRPLKSRRWQTQFHAYKMIAIVWAASLTWNAPIIVVSRLKDIRGGRRKCREQWPSFGTERAFNLFLDVILLLIPLVAMSVAYSRIAIKLWRGLRQEIRQTSKCQQRSEKTLSSGTTVKNSAYTADGSGPNASSGSSGLGEEFRSVQANVHGAPEAASSRVRMPRRKVWKVLTRKSDRESNFLPDARLQIPANEHGGIRCETKDSGNEESQVGCSFNNEHVIRSNYTGKSIDAKKKVIRMLFVIVLEFFVCWAPLHVVNTWYLFEPELVYSVVGSTGISLIQLLAYISSCCNPITYCFMNEKFRQAFLSLFGCRRCGR